MAQRTAQELMQIIATPAALGKHIGKPLLGKPYKAYPWILYMEQKVMAMIHRPGNELMIVSVAPQQGKSIYCGTLLPAWYLGLNPYNRVINASYSDTHAGRSGMKVRNILQRWGPELFGVSVSGTKTADNDWYMDNDIGGMTSAGIKGGITGLPGNLIVADDLIKGAEDANSTTIKKKIMEEWDGSLSARFQDDTKGLLIATRWTQDDPSGELIARTQVPGYRGIKVTVLNIKALAEPDPEEKSKLSSEELEEWTDFLGRHYGEGLKGQHSQRFFEMRRDSLPPKIWNCMYQGTPISDGSGMFAEDNWRYWSDDEYDKVDGDADLPDLVKRVRVWDLATSPGGGDYTVGSLVGKDIHGRIFILDRQRVRYAPTAVEDLVLATAMADGYEVDILIEQERAGAGVTTVEHYQQVLPGYNVQPAKAEMQKESRAAPYSIQQGRKMVFLPRHAHWNREWISEHAQMDGQGGRPRHDDQIDTGSYAVRHLLGNSNSILWDSSQVGTNSELTGEERLEMEALRYALGVS